MSLDVWLRAVRPTTVYDGSTRMATDWSRWQGWRGHVTYWKGWAAWQVYRVLPAHRMPSWSYLWLLPSVGDWAYWDDAMRAMRDET